MAEASIEDAFEEFCCKRGQSNITVVVRSETREMLKMKEIIAWLHAVGNDPV